jgi:aspartate aminotransferase
VQAPPDSILGLNEQFKADTAPNKLNLGVGAYRTEAGDPLVLNVVRKAELKIVTNPASTKEYLGITGLPEFCKLAQKLAFGDVPAVGEGRIVTAQALSGTGSLRVGAEFLANFWPCKTIYVCQPTWGNHNKIFPKGGLTVKPYRYFDAVTKVRTVLALRCIRSRAMCAN